MTDTDRRQSLIAAHEARIAALLSGDLDALRKVVAEDMIYISSRGQTSTRADVIRDVEAGNLRIQRMDTSNVSVRLFGDIGILIYDADAAMTHGETKVEGMTRSTTIYAHRDGAWRMISQHQSRLE